MTTTVRLEPGLEKRLAALAKITGRTKSYYLRQALIEKIEDMEDIYIAGKRLEEDDGYRISLEDAMKKHGITKKDLKEVSLDDLED